MGGLVIQHRDVSPTLTFHSSWGPGYREAVNSLSTSGRELHVCPGSLITSVSGINCSARSLAVCRNITCIDLATRDSPYRHSLTIYAWRCILKLSWRTMRTVYVLLISPHAFPSALSLAARAFSSAALFFSFAFSSFSFFFASSSSRRFFSSSSAFFVSFSKTT